MNNKKINLKNMLPVGIATVILGGSILGASAASAHGANGNSDLISKLAAKFGVSESEVQTVFDENRAEMEADREARYTAMLDEAVANGDLTEAQKSLVLTKRVELEANRPDRPGNPGERAELSEEEREAQRAERQAQMDALKTWADDNGINMKYLMGAKGGRGGHK